MKRFVGIDVGSRWLDVVALDGHGRVVSSYRFAAGDSAAVVRSVEGADTIAVDSPDRWSAAPHAADTSLPPKFRPARCAEIGLATQFGVWVPWVTPTGPAGGWMSVGIELFAALRRAGHSPIEVYPYAAFRRLNGGQPLRPKQSEVGAQQRRALLEAGGVDIGGLAIGSHDVLDATVAAVVALHAARGPGAAATCGHDGSAIWLPATRPR
jgi:predicted nuclease with RNAse H fold